MPEVAPSTQLVRRVNARAVLKLMRGSGVMTGTDLIEATGLSRATVISVCDELVGLGWLRELENQRESGEYIKGRPARRFVFDDRAAFVLGIDVGERKITAVVGDMAGTFVAKAASSFGRLQASAGERADALEHAAAEALERAGVAPESVLAVSVGIAAPVGRDGEVLTVQEFWKAFDIRGTISERHSWQVLIENDANLAALAERWRGKAQGVDDAVVLLAGERLGSGVLESGRLLHGRHGGFGELGYLYNLKGVGGPEGIAYWAREWARHALEAPGRRSLLRAQCGGDPGRLTAEMVFAAAAEGDEVARGVLDRVATRMARVIGSLSTMVNPELVVIAGAVAGSARAIIPAIERRLPSFTSTPPRVEASALSDDIVPIGALRHALDYVEEHALDLHPGSLPERAPEPLPG